MKRTTGIALVLVTATVILTLVGWLLAFRLVPPSIQIYLAAVAGCEVSDELLAQQDSAFEGIKYWERPLAYVYRWNQLVQGDNFIISDFLVKNESVFHILLTASDSTKRMCDHSIVELARHYHQKGAPINHYNDRGLTPLHEAVIMGNVGFTLVYIEFGANKALIAQRQNSKVTGMDVYQMIEMFQKENPGTDGWRLTREVLESEI